MSERIRLQRLDEHRNVGSRAYVRVHCGSLSGLGFGQAFRDTFDETIEHHHVPHHPYDSFVQGDRCRIETDASGNPIFVEVRFPVKPPMTQRLVAPDPETVSVGSLKLLDRPIRIHEVSILVDRYNALTFIKLSDSSTSRFVCTSQGIIWAIDTGSRLCGIWIQGVRDDPSGSIRARWRQRSWLQARRRMSANGCRGSILPVSARDPKDFLISTIFA